MGKRKKAIRTTFLMCVALSLSLFLFAIIPEMKSSAAEDFRISNGVLLSYEGTEERITLPEEVKVIGAEAFAGNTTLISVVAGNQVREIRSGAFSNNTALKRVSLGEGLREVGSGIFAGCSSLISVAVDPDNPWFLVSGNGLYDKKQSVLYAYFGGSSNAKYTMPSTVTKIADYAFWGNENLKEVSLSPALSEISGYAFSGCKALSKVEFPYSVKSIDMKAFENCISLKEVTISSSVGHIHATAFDGCSQLLLRASEGSAAWRFYQDWQENNWGKKKEVMSSVSVNEIPEESVSENAAGGVDPSYSDIERARNHPSNVDYIPSFNPLDREEEGVLGKTIVVGKTAVVLMDSSLSVN